MALATGVVAGWYLNEHATTVQRVCDLVDPQREQPDVEAPVEPPCMATPTAHPYQHAHTAKPSERSERASEVTSQVPSDAAPSAAPRLPGGVVAEPPF